MSSSGRLIGWILTIAGFTLAIIIGTWLMTGVREGTLQSSGAVFGFLFAVLIIIAPLIGAGFFFITRGRAEEKASAHVRQQRRLLDMLTTRGELSIPDVAIELGLTREQIEGDLYDLVGLGLFTGFVDWRKGELHSVEAAQLQGRTTCPNCGGQLELAGKGLIKCPYCGAEIFLGPGGAREIAPPQGSALSVGGGTR